ncbi:MAG: ABC transporter substrate-binding protein [Xanthobacteraceae bacterium]
MTVYVGRRKLLGALGTAIAWPLSARAQVAAKKRALIGWLSGSASKVAGLFADDFVDGMRDLGYIDGRDFDLAPRYAEGFGDRLPALAQEIVDLKPDVIVAAAVNAAVPAHTATSAIPIVCPALADAVHLGLITSEARPGGNVTGIEPYVTGLPAKQMEFAREIVPGATRIGLLTNLQDPKAPPQRQELVSAAKASELMIAEADINSPAEIEGAVETLANSRVDVVIVLQTGLLLSVGRQIAELAAAKRLPTVYGYREHVLDGGLISYGVDLRWCYRRGAYFVDKILHGTPPGELPVEFPTKMMLSINLKTAKTLGLTVAPSLLATADEVIE